MGYRVPTDRGYIRVLNPSGFILCVSFVILPSRQMLDGTTLGQGDAGGRGISGTPSPGGEADAAEEEPDQLYFNHDGSSSVDVVPNLMYQYHVHV